MSDMAKAQSFEDGLEASIKALFHTEFPYTPTSIINKVSTAGVHAMMSHMRSLKDLSEKQGVKAIDFLDLPAELRNLILEFAVSNGQDICIGPTFSNWWPHPPFQPAITRVSRQMRKDALPMFYALNHFVTRLDYGSMLDYDRGSTMSK